MGYYYDGKFLVSYDSEQLVSMSLDKFNLQRMIAAHHFNWSLDVDGIVSSVNEIGSKSDTVLNVLEYLGWEEEGADVNTDGNVLREGYISSAKYNNIVPTLVRWLSQHGVGIEVSCNGEDGESWRYRNEKGVSNFVEEKLLEISASELARYKRMEEVISQLKIASRSKRELIIEELAQLI